MEALGKYRQWMELRGLTPAHIAQSLQRLKTLQSEQADLRKPSSVWTVVSLSVALGRWSRATGRGYLHTYNAFRTWHAESKAGVQGVIPVSSPGISARCLAGRDQQRRRALGPAEWSTFLRTTREDADTRCSIAGPARAVLYDFAAHTGLRLSELRRLRRTDFHVDKAAANWVRVQRSKGGWVSSLPICNALRAQLEIHWLRLKSDAAPVFDTLPVAPSRMVKRDLRRSSIAAVDACGRKYDFHALRVQCAVWLRDSGVAWPTIQRWLGHRSARTTLDVYCEPWSGVGLLDAMGVRDAHIGA